MKLGLLIFLAFVITLLCESGEQPSNAMDSFVVENLDTIINVNFDSHPVGKYTHEMAHEDWKTLKWVNLHDRANIVKDNDPEWGNVMSVLYPKGSLGPNEGGSQFLLSLPLSEELWFSYYIKFKEGFDFRKGGKLPGLTSGNGRFAGGRKPENGEGWTARYMWKRNGGAMLYLYYVDMPGKWGENLSLDGVTFTPGKWYQITQHIKVNTQDKANGIIEVWINDKKVLSRSDLRLRLGNKGLIDSMYFSTFFGGNTRDWSPLVDCYIFFDQLVISENPQKSLPSR